MTDEQWQAVQRVASQGTLEASDDVPVTAAEAGIPFNIETHNGTVTVHNPASGNHRTFKIHTQPAEASWAPGRRVVSLLIGSDNEENYLAFGFVFPGGSVVPFRKYQGTIYARYCDLLRRPQQAEQKWGMRFLWSARCRRCNRKLTTPESLASGIGPTCEEREQS